MLQEIASEVFQEVNTQRLKAIQGLGPRTAQCVGFMGLED